MFFQNFDTMGLGIFLAKNPLVSPFALVQPIQVVPPEVS
jgi:hypothetical protein